MNFNLIAILTEEQIGKKNKLVLEKNLLGNQIFSCYFVFITSLGFD